MGQHDDDEPEMGKVIGSLSLGATRKFRIKHNITRETQTMQWIKAISRLILAALMVGAGVMHFLYPSFFLKIVPPYLSFHRELVAVSGTRGQPRDHRHCWNRSMELDANTVAVGKQEGIHFDFDRMERTPNTFDAHRLIWLSDKEGIQDAIVEALFLTYFTERRDIGNRNLSWIRSGLPQLVDSAHFKPISSNTT